MGYVRCDREQPGKQSLQMKFVLCSISDGVKATCARLCVCLCKWHLWNAQNLCSCGF